MTENTGWVWPVLERMVDIQRQRDAAKAEAARLQEEFDKEYERIQTEVPGATLDVLVNTLEAVKLFGSPVSTGGASTGNPAADPPADASVGDPLSIPAFLRRGEGSTEEGRAKLVHDAEAVARSSAP